MLQLQTVHMTRDANNSNPDAVSQLAVRAEICSGGGYDSPMRVQNAFRTTCSSTGVHNESASLVDACTVVAG